MGMSHIVISGLLRSALFFHIISLTAQYSKEKIIEHKRCVLSFSTNLPLNIFYSKKNFATYYQKCVFGFMQSNRYSCQISMNLEFSRQIFEKYSYFTKIRPFE